MSDYYKELWDQQCQAVKELCELAGAKPDEMHDVWTLELLIKELKRKCSGAGAARATETAYREGIEAAAKLFEGAAAFDWLCIDHGGEEAERISKMIRALTAGLPK